MAAQGDRIDELFKIAHTLTERVDGIREELLKGVRPDVVKLNDTTSDLSKQAALLRQELDALRGWKEQLGVVELRGDVTVL